MNAFRLWLSEWKDIAKNKKMLISLIAILLVPVLYAGMFLWAFWDPYGKMDELPVAIVNNDTGADFNGDELKLGNELVKNLKKEDAFDFQFVKKDKGYEGLENQKYYMLVEIPKNFSKNATTLLDEKPEKLELKYVPNEGFNFLSAQIGESAVEKIKSSLASQVSKTYAETVFDKVTEMADGYKNAGDNAAKLDNGIKDLGKGANEIKSNLQTLAEKQTELTGGAEALQKGANQLASSSRELADGMNKLKDGEGQLYNGVKQSQAGANQLADKLGEFNTGINQADQSFNDITAGADQLHAGIKSLQDQTKVLGNSGEGINKLQAGAQGVNDGIAKLNQQLTGLLPMWDQLPAEQKQAAIKQLTASLQQLQDGSAAVAQGTKQLPGTEQLSSLVGGIAQLEQGSANLAAGTKKFDSEALAPLKQAGTQLQAGANQLAEGQNTLFQGFKTFDSSFATAQNGSSQLADGAAKLANGTNELQSGSSQLANGAGQLAEGSGKLTNGVSELQKGSGEFKDKLNEAADEAGSVHPNDQTYDMMSSPVDVNKKAVNEVPNYGTGFTPYFLSLGMFVGALLLSIVFPMREVIRQPKTAFGWFISKFGVMFVVGVIQALIASTVVLGVLGLEVQSVPLFIMMTIIISITYMALIQFLVTTMGDPGRFIAILLLIFQLTTSAGTFPLELIPDFLQYFNAWLPMTYSVQAFKAVISSGNFDFMWQNIGYLAIFIVVTLAGTYSYFVYKFNKLKDHKWTERQQTV